MFSIGEFSRITGLTIKTLRYYHEQNILAPSAIDPDTGYRFYDDSKVESAKAIVALRNLEFSIAEIKEILSNSQDDSDFIDRLESQKKQIQERMKNDRRLMQLLENIISYERDSGKQMKVESYSVEEKTVEPMLIASVQMVGQYSDCGKGFSKIGRSFGRFISGKPMLLHHDSEYKEQDAKFDVAIPINKGKSKGDITVSELEGGKCISLMHQGPYDELNRSYEKIFRFVTSKKIKYKMPTREIYHKGPGMIFRGNPKKYLTEIILMIDQ